MLWWINRFIYIIGLICFKKAKTGWFCKKEFDFIKTRRNKVKGFIYTFTLVPPVSKYNKNDKCEADTIPLLLNFQKNTCET